MSENEEKRMAGDYVIIHALHIGDREIVLGENPADVGNERYMCAFCQTNGLLASYTEVMVSDDYPELVKLFGERVAEQAEKTRIELNGPKLQGIPNDPITADGCEVIGHGHDLRGKIVVIKPEVLRPEYRRANCQIQLCSGGFGASPNSRGWETFFDSNNTPEFKAEFNTVLDMLRFDERYGHVLKNRSTMIVYCLNHPEGKFRNGYEYAFRADTKDYSYMIRCLPGGEENDVYIYPYHRESLDLHMKQAEKGIRFAELNGPLAAPLEPTFDELNPPPEPKREYRFSLGNTVYLGAQEYELLAFDEQTVRLYDPSFPLINKEVPREEFDRMLAENPLNDHLLVEIEAEPQPEAKKYALGYGYLGNGVSVWNRLEEEHGDYKTIAHIDPDRTVTFYDDSLPEDIRAEIEQYAAISDMTISATQDAPVFATPPQVRELAASSVDGREPAYPPRDLPYVFCEWSESSSFEDKTASKNIKKPWPPNGCSPPRSRRTRPGTRPPSEGDCKLFWSGPDAKRCVSTIYATHFPQLPWSTEWTSRLSPPSSAMFPAAPR